MFFRQSILTAEDRISALPDSLICHILSFLPTKLAVATSILSNHWTPLWKSVLTLDVDEEDFKDFGSFQHFLQHYPTLPLQSFRIRCGNYIDFDPCDLNRLVHAAVQRQLEIFNLELFPRKYDLQKVAPSVLSCRTLVVLKLTNFTVYEIPQLVDLPLLKTLHLNMIYFESHFAHIMNLFNGCPILECLHTYNVKLNHDWHESKEDFKGFPNLVRANLRDTVLNFRFAWLYNAKFMRVELNMGFLSVPVIEVEDWKDSKTVPECLSSQLRTCSLEGYKGIENEMLHFAEYIMVNSKLLCTMTIKSGYWVDEKEKHQLLERLSSYPRGSATCKLLFD